MAPKSAKSSRKKSGAADKGKGPAGGGKRKHESSLETQPKDEMLPPVHEDHQGTRVFSRRTRRSNTRGDLMVTGQSSHGNDEVPVLGGFWFKEDPVFVIPVATLFQAELPECSKNAYESDAKWLGTCIWRQGQEVVPSVPAGIERQGQCNCRPRDSSDCRMLHVSEKRNRLRVELGVSFDQFGFDKMGEEVESPWTKPEKKRLESYLKTSRPPTTDWKLRQQFRRRFSNMTIGQMVSYYYNFHLLRLHRNNPGMYDSDDDVVASRFLKH